MATKTINTRISLKYDTYKNWSTNNPVLLAGEVAVCVVEANDKQATNEPAILLKCGDGTKKFNELGWISGLSADNYAWSKAATKPTYNADEIVDLDSYISGKVQDTNTTYKIEVDATNPRKFQLYKHELSETAGTWNSVGEPITIPVSTLVTGTTNGTVKFNGTDVAVAGLKDAAYATVDGLNNTARGYANEVLGTADDAATENTVHGAKKAAADALAAANTKVASVAATADKGIEIGGTATAPTVGIKLDPATGNAATVSAAGLKVTVPAAAEYTIAKKANSGDFAAVYQLTKDGTPVGVNINIPKDMVVKSGEVVKDPAGQTAGTYIVLTLANATSDKLYINVDSLIEYVTGGTPADGIITTSVSDDFVLTATINNGTITKEKLVTDVQTSLGKADSALQKADIKTGTANGNISVDGTDVPVAGLKDAAYATVDSLNSTAKGYADDVLGTTTDGADKNTVYGVKASVTALTGVVDNKIDTTAVSQIGKTGNINDVIQTEGDYVVFDCGNSSTRVGAL
nr:MAG TPA: hyaluronidase [Caudoviricetes sp.]